MANLIIKENGQIRYRPAVNGEEIIVQAPCNCSEVTGVQVNNVIFPFYDAAGHNLSNVNGLFAEGSLIKIMLDTVKVRAYILNHGISASQVSAGTFAGQVVANSEGQSPSTYLLRNSKLSATEETPTVNGQICWLYE
jgi:hypothetical protein